MSKENNSYLPGLKICKAEVDGQILIITINRPEVLNALNPEAHHELSRVFDAFSEDSNLRVAIITGTGTRGFCVGSDLKSKLHIDNPLTQSVTEKPPTGFAGLCARFDLYKPVIAAVNGAAIGGGMEIVMACDLAVAAEHAVFSLPEPRVGLASLGGGGGLARIVRQIPMKQAMRLILTCEQITAREALEMGLINEVVPAGEELSKARELAEKILLSAPLAIEASKAVALASLSNTLERSILDQHPAAMKMLLSEDAKEGPRAFVEKRPPRWTGKLT
jgi:enoyl-CoA hydratase/carnithine racemase